MYVGPHETNTGVSEVEMFPTPVAFVIHLKSERLAWFWLPVRKVCYRGKNRRRWIPLLIVSVFDDRVFMSRNIFVGDEE